MVPSQYTAASSIYIRSSELAKRKLAGHDKMQK